jgi:glycosyltransferase involved in cell wall biosynthesis
MILYLDRHIGVVVPARDEGLLIGRTLKSMPSFVDHVVVVNDGSRDQTAIVVHQLARADARITLIHNSQSKGVGAAILKGYSVLAAAGVDIIAVMAGDAQMDPRDLAPLLAPICRNEADYVKGDRFSHPHLWRSMPNDRILGNLVLTWLTRRASGYQALRDAQCGYTAIAASWVPRLSDAPIEPGYGFPNSLLSYLGGAGARLGQVCVRPIYGDEKSGLKMSNVLRRYPRVLWDSWKMRCSVQDTPSSDVFESTRNEDTPPVLRIRKNR